MAVAARGYAWLDPADRYRVRDVGLYLARYGALITWPLPDLTAALLATPDRPDRGRDIAATAEQFRRLAEHVIVGETGHPAEPTPQR